METLTITSSPKLRGVPADALKGVRLASKTLFYGVNGSGKTTICDILREPEKIEFSSGVKPKFVHAFTGEWMHNTVGEFVSGGSAPAVTTVAIGKGVAEIETEIQNATRKVEAQKKIVAENHDKAKQLDKRQEKVLDSVFNGARKALGARCEALGPRRFNRAHIKEFLNTGANEILSKSEVDRCLAVSNMATRPQIEIPQLGGIWAPTEKHKEMIETPVLTRGNVVLNSWIREGFDRHSAGDDCEFCGNTVTKERLEQLEIAIAEIHETLDSELLAAIQSAEDSLGRLNEWGYSVRQLRVEDGDGVESFEECKAKALNAASDYVENLKEFRDCAVERRDNPHGKVRCPSVMGEKFDQSSAFHDFVAALAAVNENRLNLEERKADSFKRLKAHCCSTDGAGWNELIEERKEVDREKSEALRDLEKAEDDLRIAEDKLSTTVWVAEFIDDGLRRVLGEGNLSVEQSQDGTRYVLKRLGEKATFLSEGEKKLVALLYFCSTLYEPETKSTLSESIIVFDDLASELDYARQANISRFIDRAIGKLSIAPLSVCYFTHSSEFLRQKLPAFRDKIFASERRGKVPNVAVYEVYKTPGWGQLGGATTVAAWSKRALAINTEYDFALYKVCAAAVALRAPNRTEQIDFLVGNYCRKVLEVFSEFKRPGGDSFGQRVNEMMEQGEYQKPLPAGLSRSINELCHSHLSKENPLWTQQFSILAIYSTLRFLYCFDAVHLELMVHRLLGKEEWEHIKPLVDEIY